MCIFKVIFFITLLFCVCFPLRLRNKMRSHRPIFNKYRAESKITFGEEADPHSIPYQAALFQWGLFYICSGSLVADRWVLTAAHCIGIIGIFDYKVVKLGAHRVFQGESSQQKIAVQKSFKHPSYRFFELHDDIALTYLSRKAVLNEYVGIIPMVPADAPDFAGSLLQVSGWGNTENLELSSVLLYVRLLGITNSNCKQLLRPEFINDGVLCAATSEGKSACHGDSGGPLVDLQSGMLAGITSFGNGDYRCYLGPAVGFTRVSYYRDWIDDVMNN